MPSNDMDEALMQLLEWLYFTVAEINQIEAEGFQDFDDFVSTTQEELKSMVDGFYKRSDVDVTIPMKRRKLLYDVHHWCLDFDRRSMEVALNWPNESINNIDEAFQAMTTARECNTVRKSIAEKPGDQVKGPGKFTPNEYATWEKALTNKLASITGVKGVPLTYVIRKLVDTKPEDLIGQTFLAQTVLQAPLHSAAFEADSRDVHQMIVASTAGSDAEQFLKQVNKFECGRKDMEVIRAFYEGTGSMNRRLLESKLLLKHLHYKSERQLPFATFVAKLTGIYQALSDGDQEKGEPEKIEIFFEKFQCDSLVNEIIACKFDYNRNGGTFANLANTMADHIKPVNSHQQFSRGRQVSAIGTTHVGQAPEHGVYLADGTIYTGKYEGNDYHALSKDDKDALRQARSNHKAGGNNGKGHSRKIKAVRKQVSTKMKKVKKQLQDSRRSLAALQAAHSAVTPDAEMPPAPPPIASVTNGAGASAGSAFGGRAGRG